MVSLVDILTHALSQANTGVGCQKLHRAVDAVPKIVTRDIDGRAIIICSP